MRQGGDTAVLQGNARRAVRWALIAGILCIFISTLGWAEEGEKKTRRKMLTLVGQLMRVAGVGGATIGWAVELESEIDVNGGRVKRIEVDPGGKRIDGLENKRVEIRGALIWRGHPTTKIEGGYYPVVEIETVHELKY